MEFVDVFVNEGVLSAELALKHAPSDRIVEECRNYITHLNAYRLDRHKIACLTDDEAYTRSPLARELILQARAAVYAVIETTFRETDRTEKLLEFFTSISADEAAVVLSTCKHLNSANWGVNASGIGFANGFDTGQMSLEQAVRTAGRLRREAYVVVNRKMDMPSSFEPATPEISETGPESTTETPPQLAVT